MKTIRPTEPRSGDDLHPTTLNLTIDIHERLEALSHKTGAPKSVIVRRLLDKHLPDAPRTPAA